MPSDLPQAAWLISGGVGLNLGARTPAPLGPPNTSSLWAAGGHGRRGEGANGTPGREPQASADHSFCCPLPQGQHYEEEKRALSHEIVALNSHLLEAKVTIDKLSEDNVSVGLP